MDAVVLDDVSVVYEGERIPAIHDINLRIGSGEFVTIIGPNGSGKTTLLETINGLLDPTHGEVKVFGLSVREHGRQVRKKTAYVIQNFSLDPLDPFLCRDVVMMARVGRIGILRFPAKNDWRAVDEALDAVGMRAFAKRPIGKLSGGEFQKILLARAIAQEPDLVLLDEPLANLDVDSRRQILHLLQNWKTRKELTVVMVSHDIAGIPAFCDRVVVMENGRIVLQGSSGDVLRSPKLSQLFISLGELI